MDPAALLLAVACTLEIDLGTADKAERWDRECQLMWSVHEERAEATGLPLEQVIASYVAGLRCEGKRCDSRRARAIRSLRDGRSEPCAGWIDAKEWRTGLQALWLRRVRIASAFLDRVRAHESPWPEDARPLCRRARHYGGRCAAGGACDLVPPCWRLAPCGQTEQAYWIVRDGCSGRTLSAPVAMASGSRR